MEDDNDEALKQVLDECELGYASGTIHSLCYTLDEICDQNDGVALELINECLFVPRDQWDDVLDDLDVACQMHEDSDDIFGDEDSDDVELKPCSNPQHSVLFPDIPRDRRLSEFYRDRNTSDGLTTRCRDCQKVARRQQTVKANKKRGRETAAPQVRRCRSCGQAGHAYTHCTSANKIPEGKRRCNCPSHGEWFPGTPLIQDTAEFYKGRSACKKCTVTLQKQRSTKKRGRAPRQYRCGVCGKSDHKAQNCSSSIIAEGKKFCNCPNHTEWFPDIPVIQLRSNFYKGVNACKRCKMKKSTLNQQRKRSRKK